MAQVTPTECPLAEGFRGALPSDRRGSDRGKEMTAGLRSKSSETYGPLRVSEENSQ